MKEQEAGKLLDRYLKGQASAQEEAIVQSWLMRQTSVEQQAESEADYQIPAGMWDKVYAGMHREQHPVKKVKLWTRIAAVSSAWKVAAAVAVITLGVWLYYASGLLGNRHLEGSTATRDLYTNDIAPGRNTATITFDDSEVVDLNDKELDISSETPQFLASRISQSKTVVLSTSRGGTYQVVLPDGTKAWLNAASTIKFPSSFAGAKQRRIEITGEVYLEVAKSYITLNSPVTPSPSKNKGGERSFDRLRMTKVRIPFIVISKGQQVEALGTHFNINAYPTEATSKTTLLEGSVSVSALPSVTSSLRGGTTKQPRGPSTTQSQIILRPGEQAINNGEALKVTQANMEETVAWKDGYFRFNGQKIDHVMNELARWYDIEVSYEGKITEDGFNGRISRYKNISQVLRMLENTGLVHFKIEGRRVSVLK